MYLNLCMNLIRITKARGSPFRAGKTALPDTFLRPHVPNSPTTTRKR